MFSWATRVARGAPYYEVSTKGDSRFSALVARIQARDGRSIEHIYQVDLKGHPTIAAGKGRAPLTDVSTVELYAQYKELWKEYLSENPELLEELRLNTEGKTITDMFSLNSPINQARALTEILNETANEPV